MTIVIRGAVTPCAHPEVVQAIAEKVLNDPQPWGDFPRLKTRAERLDSARQMAAELREIARASLQ